MSDGPLNQAQMTVVIMIRVLAIGVALVGVLGLFAIQSQADQIAEMVAMAQGSPAAQSSMFFALLLYVAGPAAAYFGAAPLVRLVSRDL